MFSTRPRQRPTPIDGLRSPHSAEFCGTHVRSSPCEAKGKRVPCPVDPNHTVFERHLSAHVKICNLAVHENQLEQQPYFSKGVNSGPLEPSVDGEIGSDGCAREGEGGGSQDGDNDHTAEGLEKGVAATLDECFILDVVSRVSAAHRTLVGDLPTEVLDPPEVQALHTARLDTGVGFRKGRHVLQQASIVGHMLKRRLVGPDAGNVYVEMGAGKGALGQAIATAFPGADVTMVERSAVRRKAENRLSGGNGTRARIDIRDLNMAGLPSVNGEGDERPVVAVAKHLCGVATDLALRALLTLPRSNEATSGTEAPGKHVADVTPPAEKADVKLETPGEGKAVGAISSAGSERVGGVAIATCCHHVCNWRDYAGREFLKRLGFTARDFEAMRRISAWISLEPDAGTRKNNDYPAEESSRNVLPPPSGSPASRRKEEFSQKKFAENASSTATTTTTIATASPDVETQDSYTAFEGEPSQGGEAASQDLTQQLPHRTAGDSTRESAKPPSPPPPGIGERLDRTEAGHQDDMRGRAEGHDLLGSAEAEGAGAFPALSAAEKARAARECKRLLDRGRAAFVEERLGLRAELVHFVGKEITPENALLLGFRG